LNVEGKLAKILDTDDVLVVKAADRNMVLDQISARAARYKKFDVETYNELMNLRKEIRDIFNKGQAPGSDLMEDLYFLDQAGKDVLEKMSRNYERIVTPQDFNSIAKIMSEHLAEQVPILKSFTRFYGRLAEDFLSNAKPSDSAMDWKSLVKLNIFGKKGYQHKLPDRVNEALGIPPGKPVSETFLRRLGIWQEKGILSDILLGAQAPDRRVTGRVFFKVEILKLKTLLKLELFTANKLPKKWTNVPSVNFDGHVLEQTFTQKFEERLTYRDEEGNWVINILNVPQKTEATWWEQAINKSGAIYDIADTTRARTAFGVNANHSNDAVLVKKFHQWGRKAKVATSTIHDAFFTNAGEMLKARKAMQGIYKEALQRNVIKETLDEMLARGFPKKLYKQYLNEAEELGLIPVPGKSTLDGKLMTEDDILKLEDFVDDISEEFNDNKYWYGVG
jgi:hypothetical protein